MLYELNFNYFFIFLYFFFVIKKKRKGIGKIHAKFSPVSVANFQHIPVIKLNEKLNDFELDKKQEFIKSCPTNVYTINPNT